VDPFLDKILNALDKRRNGSLIITTILILQRHKFGKSIDSIESIPDICKDNVAKAAIKELLESTRVFTMNGDIKQIAFEILVHFDCSFERNS
jgi:hypothetical protein